MHTRQVTPQQLCRAVPLPSSTALSFPARFEVSHSLAFPGRLIRGLKETPQIHTSITKNGGYDIHDASHTGLEASPQSFHACVTGCSGILLPLMGCLPSHAKTRELPGTTPPQQCNRTDAHAHSDLHLGYHQLVFPGSVMP